MIFNHNSYRTYLKDVLAERISHNPSYSLRAFAKQIGLNHSTLVQVFKAQKNLSADRAHLVGTKLKLTELELEYFELLVRFESAKRVEIKASIEEKINSIRPKEKTHDLNVDLFKLISDWYHLPILQLVNLENFSLTAEAASEKLGIHIHEASAAIDRLERLELLEKNDKGTLRLTKNRLLTHSEIPNLALRRFHQQMLARASEALESQAPKERVSGSETLALDPNLLETARKITDNYFQQIVKLSGISQNKTHVYHLAVNMFSVTKGKI